MNESNPWKVVDTVIAAIMLPFRIVFWLVLVLLRTIFFGLKP